MATIGGKFFSTLTSASALLLVLGAAPLGAQVLLVHAGEAAEYQFHFDSPPMTSDGPADFLTFFGGGGLNTLSPFSLTISLYDGVNLLGSADVPSVGQMWTTFKDPSSPFDYNTVVDVDFSSIADGTIDGRLVFTPRFASAEFEPDFSVDIYIGTGKPAMPGGFWPGPNAIMDAAFVRPAQTPVPEASLYSLFATAFLGALCFWGKRRVAV